MHNKSNLSSSWLIFFINTIIQQGMSWWIIPHILFYCFYRSWLYSQTASHHHHSQAAGDTEERLQQLAQTSTARPWAALLRDGPWHESGPGQSGVRSSPFQTFSADQNKARINDLCFNIYFSAALSYIFIYT